MPLRPKLPENFMEYDFKTAYKREPNPRTRMRLLGLMHLQTGKSYREVSQLLQVNHQTVSRWVTQFDDQGFEGLTDKPRSGANPRLPREQERIFKDTILDLHKEKTGKRITAKDVQELLHQKFDVFYSISGIYDLLKRLEIN